MIKFLSASSTATRKIGRILGEEILKSKPDKSAMVLALKGDLGSGKTTFLQGLSKGLKVRGIILSPTFVIIKRFNIVRGRRFNKDGFRNFYHIDCYRIKKPKELELLGFGKMIADPKNIVVIEWAERAKKILPKNSIIISFRLIDRNKREIKIIGR